MNMSRLRFINLRFARDAFLKPSVWSLLIANLYPLFGVLFLGWDTFPLLVLFWAENVVVGLFNVARMALAAGGTVSTGEKLALIPFFCVHYGMFTFVHGIFVFVLFGGMAAEGWESSPGDFSSYLNLGQLALGFLVLFASHSVSFVTNYIQGGEYRQADARMLMMAPYGRVVILHLTIIFGGMLAMALGSPVGALVLLVVLKTVLDLGAHLGEHARLKPSTAAAVLQ